MMTEAEDAVDIVVKFTYQLQRSPRTSGGAWVGAETLLRELRRLRRSERPWVVDYCDGLLRWEFAQFRGRDYRPEEEADACGL